ncbi:MAG TPA: sugar transferase, partial [Acidimicrobiales bacterium]|nr:sugar transferase [Acidimicrobiales bacterium]
MRSPALKRAIDVVVAAVALVVLSPILAIAALVVRLRLGSPVMFGQARAGMHGEPFHLHKLRSMTDERDP